MSTTSSSSLYTSKRGFLRPSFPSYQSDNNQNNNNNNNNNQNNSKTLIRVYLTGLRQRLPTSSLRQLDQLKGITEERLQTLKKVYPGLPDELIALLQVMDGTGWEVVTLDNNNHQNQNKEEEDTLRSATFVGLKKKFSEIKELAAKITHGEGQNTNNNNNQTNNSMENNILMTDISLFGLYREKLAVPVLGSVLPHCPYYLRSSQQMLEHYEKMNAPHEPYNHQNNNSVCCDEIMDLFPPYNEDSARQPLSSDINSQFWQQEESLQQFQHIIGHHPQQPQNFDHQYYKKHHHNNQTKCSSIYDIYTASQFTIKHELPPKKKDNKRQKEKDFCLSNHQNNNNNNKDVSKKHRTVYVDPKINLHADVKHGWLAFADSVYPHYRRKLADTSHYDAHQHPHNILHTNHHQNNNHNNNNNEHNAAHIVDTSHVFIENEVPNTLHSSQLLQQQNIVQHPSEANNNNNNNNPNSNNNNNNNNTGVHNNDHLVLSESRLYIDFLPSSEGCVGQVIQFTRQHPYDSFIVIADSFKDYVRNIMKQEYEFTEKLEDDEEDEEEDDDEEDD
ncbi:hypothetical protein ADEAN_000475100 [Angomonas deanei]|uniref:Knr4/Smi1-like domain-containing protein n=1 Tax=Angomonas deanei TaxID=59799 RepID=A0A7G2CEZ6_9TRYP|nr:hypothetical protein ADEAN_000475100 [Angomonas deanei]